MKTEFELLIKTDDAKIDSGAKAIITNGFGKLNTFVHFDFGYGNSNRYYIQHKDLERFAVNILKALDSDYLQPLWARKGAWGKKKEKEFRKNKKLETK